MIVHLVDGTYELFRCFYGLKNSDKPDDPFGAVRAVLAAVLQMVEQGATHLGVATDHVIESFRNDMWPGYKTGAGIDPLLWSQFRPLEEALAAFGFTVWPMIELEADDALASASAISRKNKRVEKICIWTPDKDLAQCVVEDFVVQIDRRSGQIRDAEGVKKKFGVEPASIPDYLALVGDSSDGYPGLPGWGAKSASRVLATYMHLEGIPLEARDWKADVSAGKLSATLRDEWPHALLFRELARLRTDAKLFSNVDDLKWKGPAPGFESTATRIGGGKLAEKAVTLQKAGRKKK